MKGPIAIILGFMGCFVSLATIPLHCRMKAAIDNEQTNERGLASTVTLFTDTGCWLDSVPWVSNLPLPGVRKEEGGNKD